MSLLLIDKPEGPTSHAVVATIKRALGADKVGHLGTLDPFASGLLPVMLGNTARLADEAMDGKKGYLFTIGFGHETDTLDPTGKTIAEAACPSSEALASLEDTLGRFRGQIEQVPPVYSALKMNGMPLYEYMRGTGKLPIDIETKRRKVNIESLEKVDVNSEQLTLRVICSKGTYVRSLARDIAKALGSVGTCVRLRREMVEPWHVDQALRLNVDANGRIMAPEKSVLLERCQPCWSIAPTLPRAQIPESFGPRLLSGNAMSLNDSEITWDFKPKTASPAHVSQESIAEGIKLKLFVSCIGVTFLCEASPDNFGGWLIQPRKRIQ